MLSLTDKEKRAIRFAEVYGGNRPDLVRIELDSMTSKEDAEQYLDKADTVYQEARKFKIVNELGQESDVTYTLPQCKKCDIQLLYSARLRGTGLCGPCSVKCLHCSKPAIASCLVANVDMILQLVCEDHICGQVIWRNEHAL